MRIYRSEPLGFVNNRIKIPLKSDDIRDENVYEEVWLPVGDDKETDILSLLEQHRVKKY